MGVLLCYVRQRHLRRIHRSSPILHEQRLEQASPIPRAGERPVIRNLRGQSLSFAHSRFLLTRQSLQVPQSYFARTSSVVLSISPMSIGDPSITSFTCFFAVSLSRDRRSLASTFDSVLLVLLSVLSTTVSPETFKVNFRTSSVILSCVTWSEWRGDAVFTSVGVYEKLSEPEESSIDPSPSERTLPFHLAVAR